MLTNYHLCAIMHILNMPSHIYPGLKNMEYDGLINRGEATAARNSRDRFVMHHTLGYELEILRSAAPSIPRAQHIVVDPYVNSDVLPSKCENELYKYGFDTNYDGLYELISPVAGHPVALSVATRGVIRAGWLPERTRGVITAHISVGTRVPIYERPDLEAQAIRILRATELVGGSVPGRLLRPLVTNGHHKMYWNRIGRLGVYTPYTSNPNAWLGGNNRIEFRSLRYTSHAQFEATLQTIYYLTRGLLAPESRPGNTIYGDFDKWFQNYCATHGLPEATADIDDRNIGPYLGPYVQHFSLQRHTTLSDKVRTTVTRLKNHFDGGVSTPTTLTTSNAPSA